MECRRLEIKIRRSVVVSDVKVGNDHEWGAEIADAQDHLKNCGEGIERQ